MNTQNHGTPFSATASGTGTASVLFSGTTGQLAFVTDISASSSGTMGTWAVLVGNTPVWQGASSVNYSFSEPIRITKGSGVSLYANGVTATYVGIAGFSIKTS